jgi:hypothetical protein
VLLLLLLVGQEATGGWVVVLSEFEEGDVQIFSFKSGKLALINEMIELVSSESLVSIRTNEFSFLLAVCCWFIWLDSGLLLVSELLPGNGVGEGDFDF